MGTKKFKITHLRKNCIGCGSCVIYDKSCWRMNNKDGKADLLNSQKKGDTYTASVEIDQLELNQMLAKACPMNIIKISEKK